MCPIQSATARSNFGTFLLTAFVAFAYWRLFLVPGPPPDPVGSLTVTSATGALAVFVAGWPVFVFVVVIGLLLVLFEGRARSLGPTDASRMYLIGGMTGAALASVGMFLFTGDMWLPQETIRLGGSTTIRGYVLEDDGPWTSILHAADRSLLFVAEGDVDSREPCVDERADAERSVREVVVELFADVPSRPRYPSCE